MLALLVDTALRLNSYVQFIYSQRKVAPFELLDALPRMEVPAGAVSKGPMAGIGEGEEEPSEALSNALKILKDAEKAERQARQ